MRRFCRWFGRFVALSPAMVLLAVLLACGVASAPVPLAAQVPEQILVSDTLQEIRLADGSTLFGRVVAVQGERITIETSAGVRVELQRAQIRSMRAVQGRVQDGEVWGEDPNTSRLFFGPTGRTVPAGAGYFGIFELIFPYLAVGVTDFLTVAAGTTIGPEITGEVIYLAPKVRLLAAPRAEVSAGVLALFPTRANTDPGTVGVAYGVGTFGTPDRAVTVGAGWGFAGDEVSNRPALMLGAESRAGRRIKLLSENYLILYEETVYDPPALSPGRRRTNAAGILSGGVRFFGERLSADAGLGLLVGEGETFCCLPLVNFVYSFGAR